MGIYRKLVARPSDAADLEYSQKLESGLHRKFMPGRRREHESSRRKCLKPTQMSNLKSMDVLLPSLVPLWMFSSTNNCPPSSMPSKSATAAPVLFSKLPSTWVRTLFVPLLWMVLRV